jgi:hypothetical protein
MFISHGITKARTVPGPHFFYRSERSSPAAQNKIFVPYASVESTMDGTQKTESDRNRWPLPKKGALEDNGSEFFTQKYEVVNAKFPYSVLYCDPSGDNGRYTRSYGNVIANCFKCHNNASPGLKGALDIPLKFNWPPDLSSSRSALVVKGTVAVAATAPTNQIANAASAVGELLQDLPAIPGVALWESRLKAVATLAAGADEFLNYVFAISPTIGDMHDFLKGVHTIDKVVDQFIRDAGRPVRRSFHFPIERDESESVLTDIWSPAGMGLSQADGTAYNQFNSQAHNAFPGYTTVRKRVTEREIWFSGAFTYHIPNGYDIHSRGDRRRLMAKLFGAQPDLNTLWQLTPWSWAVDWVSDAGSFVKNLQNLISYGTILRYGYVMEKTTTTDTFTAGEPVLPVLAINESSFKAPNPAVSPVVLRVTTKKRIQANPFGFGLSWDGLSSVQQAIVAALGITRVVR